MSHSLPPNPGRERSPPRRDDSRGPPPPAGRHDDYLPAPRDYPPPPREYPPPPRDYPPPPRDYPPGRIEFRESRDGARESRDFGRPRDTWEAEPWDRRAEGERDWDERDRGERRRPPPHWEEDFDRPKRRRSPSPGPYPASRARRHSPPPPLHPYTNTQSPDPATIPQMLSFKQFAEWFRASHPQTAKADEEELRRVRAALEEGSAAGDAGAVGKERVGMSKRYERYRKEYTSRQLYALYLIHRGSPWFMERYSQAAPLAALRRRVNRQGRVPTVEKYLEGLRAGKYDTVTFEASDEHERKPQARRMSDHEEPEGLDRALGESDEPSKIEVAPNSKQIFVKTVPPTFGRKELEGLFQGVEGFQYLALTEPSVKKSFHRVAWAQFKDDVDMAAAVAKLDGSKLDTFTFHMGVNTAPTVGRTRYTSQVANSLARLQVDAQKARDLAIKLEEELMGDDEEEEEDATSVAGEEPAKEGETVPKDGAKESEKPGNGVTASKKQDKEMVVSGLRERGSAVVEEIIARFLEAQDLAGEELSEEQQVQKAKLSLDHWISYLRHGFSTCYYCVAPMSFPEEIQRKCIAHMRPAIVKGAELEAVVEGVNEGGDDAAAEVEGVKEELGDPTADKTEEKPEAPEGTTEGEPSNDRDPEEHEGRGRDRDGEDEDRRDVEEKVGDTKDVGVARDQQQRNRYGQRSSDERWEEILDLKLRPLLDEVDVADFGGRDIEEETKKLTAPVIKQEEASKYRCKECNKLFKAPEFVIKHIVVKHGEVVQAKLDEITVFNSFVLDPQHLQPTSQTPGAIDDQLPQPTQPLMNPAFMNSANGNMGGAGMMGGNPQQQMMMMMLQMQQAVMMQMQGQTSFGASGAPGMGQEGMGLAGRMGGYANGQPGGEGGRGGVGRGGPRGGGGADAAPLPPAPPGGEDPRARRGRVSYMDLDEPGGAGDGGLPY